MKKPLFVFVVTLAGFQLFSFFLVYLSNQDLLETLTQLARQGHLVVPNARVQPSLAKILPAFYGSLFITATGGVTLALVLSLGSVLVFRPRFFSTAQGMWFSLVLGGSLSLCIALVLFFSGPSLFLKTRDYLLLSNRPGTVINDFYYRYTLHASQAVVSPLQKQIKPVWVDPAIPGRKRLVGMLEKRGWVAAKNRPGALMVVAFAGNGRLWLKNKKKTVVSLSLEAFLDDPLTPIDEFSEKTDTMAFLRLLCFAGLVAALPLVCYAGIFTVLLFGCTRVAGRKTALFLSGLLMVMMVLAVMVYLNPSMDSDKIETMLASEKSRIRIYALRRFSRTGRPASRISFYFQQPLAEKSTAERYWMANVLANSPGSRKNRAFLMALAADPALNVRCAAIRALASSGCWETTAGFFEEIIRRSGHWYEQRYALNALRHCREGNDGRG
ncbi:MAG TPA: HEAT repeat domain-containing protein [Desulfobacteraceae bacterium]|nr:HEAT repeat domain-containing protein [Desulfobacteraceae bacterium]